MIRVKSGAMMAATLVLLGLLGALLSAPVEAYASQMPAFFSHAVGLALLGIAGIAIVLVFRSLPVAPPPARARPTLRRDSEYRRGFAKGRSSANRLRIEPRIERPGQVVMLRRPVDAPAPQAKAPASRAPAAQGNIDILKRRLQYRAEALWRRHAG